LYCNIQNSEEWSLCLEAVSPGETEKLNRKDYVSLNPVLLNFLCTSETLVCSSFELTE